MLPRRRRLELILAGPPVLVAGLSLLALRGSNVSIVLPSPWLVGGAMALFLALIVIYERRDMRLADVVRAAGLGLLMSNLYALPMYALARLGRPLVDADLLASDAALGLDVRPFAHLVATTPLATTASSFVYNSLLPLSLLALIAPVLTRRASRAWELLLAIAIASIASLAVFAWFPAIGPWSMGNLAPSSEQTETSQLIAALRAHAPIVLDLARPGALIAMPSWHALLATLAARTLSWSRGTSLLAMPWGAAIVLSAVTTGWHYAIDVFVGASLAELSLWAARVFLPKLLPTRSDPDRSLNADPDRSYVTRVDRDP